MPLLPKPKSDVDIAGNGRSIFRPRQLAIQLLGFGLGLALLGWCVWGAARTGDWSVVLDADPLLIVGLAACTIVSLLANGTVFWVIIRPLRHEGYWDLQYLNAAVSFLNYAPIRLGLMARIAYHIKVDHMAFLQIMGWLAAAGSTTSLTLGSAFVATLLAPDFGWQWFAILLGLLVVGGLMLRALVSQQIVVKYGRGIDRMVGNPISLYGAVAMRLVDIFAYVGRMTCAVKILELPFGISDILLLALAALALTLLPFGRVGFREAGVAIVAGMMAADVTTDDLLGQFKALGLIESAGEVMIIVPAGLLALLLWYRPKWRDAPVKREHGSQGNAAISDDDAQPSAQ